MKLHATSKPVLGHFQSPPFLPIEHGTRTPSGNQKPIRVKLKLSFCRAPSSDSSSISASTNAAEDPDSSLIFENLKDAERQHINKVEELERKAKIQPERQLVLASYWSRTLMMILPCNKDKEKERTDQNSGKEIIFQRHVVDRVPTDGGNDVRQKLHPQIMNTNIKNMDPVHAEVYCTVAMRLALSIALCIWIYSKMRPVYAKLIPCDLGTPGAKKKRKPLTVVKNKRLGSLGKSWAKFIPAKATISVTLDDFAGQDYIKRELQEVVKILRNDEESKDRDIYCPKGVLLYGPPGTGKTLLAKAIAGESGLPFFAANGTEFVEMFPGVAASQVKDLFENARSHAPSIIFIDEVDAIGSKRGGPDIGGNSSESEQGLFQILTEMDGFKVDTSQVLVIGATNKLDILDPALLRKGRFDKIIRVGLPTTDGRLAILKAHARNKFFRSEEKEVLLEEIADLTEDFTGAELQNILNEAAILTARKDIGFIVRDKLLEALKRQKGTLEIGQEASTEIPEDLKLRLAYREAAVVVLACYFPDPHCPVIETHINSVRSEPNLRFAKARGKVFSKKSDYVNSIVCACAPRAIEEEIFGIDNLCWISSKATLKASRIAEILILQTGMTAFGKAYYRKEHNDLVPNLVPKLQALQDEYIRFAMEKCSAVLREYDSAVETITDILLDRRKIDAEEIWDIYRRAPRIPQPPVTPIDECGALVYAGRWGIHGVSLPGRVTFAPGNVGFATFGSPRPMQTQYANDQTRELIDDIRDSPEVEECKEYP